MIQIKEATGLFLKGLAMGAANVIPGVSGGTIAFITGIYDRLINSLKSFDIEAIKMLGKFQIKKLAKHIDFNFLLFLFLGIGISLVTFGKLLKWLFEIYPIPVWGFFFGLIIASVYSVGKTIKQWNAASIGGILLGAIVAIGLSFLKPATESDNFIYLMLCGVVAICSMLLPGLSGSFVLILMGNYQLIILGAVPDGNLSIIAPVAIGAMVGFIVLAHFISFMLRKFEWFTIGTLTGFILGSLLIIWPWKNEIYLLDEASVPVLKEGEKVIMGYASYFPDLGESQTLMTIALMLLGLVLVVSLDKFGNKTVEK